MSRVLVHPFLNSTEAVEAQAISEDSDKTAQMRKLIFAGRTSLIVGFVVRSIMMNIVTLYFTCMFEAVVPVLDLFFVALWFILRGDLFYVLPCVILLLCFSVLFALPLPRLGKRELI